MVAGVLHHLGVDMGPRVPPDVANPLGYFEDVRFMGLHRSWSRHYETDPKRRVLRLPPWEPIPSATDLDRYTRLIRTCEQRPRWGVKDPELCYYAGHFAAIFRHPIKVIATTRSPDAAARSLGAARRWLTAADCAMIIEEYARRQSLTINELVSHGSSPALMVDYDEALADPEGAVRRIAEHIELPVTADATAFITPGLRHHRSAHDQGVTTLTI